MYSHFPLQKWISQFKPFMHSSNMDRTTIVIGSIAVVVVILMLVHRSSLGV